MLFCNNKILLVITGPTAVGKTSWAIQIARALGTQIISADARQSYQEMAIGTARPTQEEQAQVPHHLVGHRSIHAPYHVGAFVEEALALIADWPTPPFVVVTGGTGLYLEGLTQGLSPMPPVPPSLRQRLTSRYATEGLAPLVAQLALADPIYHAQVDLANPHRVIRALAVCQATGQPYSSFRKLDRQTPPFQKIIDIGLYRDQEELTRRIQARTEAMIAQGLIEEVKRLYPYRHLPALQTIGYQELFGWLDQRYSQAEAIHLLKRHTRQYARRQMRFLRRAPHRQWMPVKKKGIDTVVSMALKTQETLLGLIS